MKTLYVLLFVCTLFYGLFISGMWLLNLLKWYGPYVRSFLDSLFIEASYARLISTLVFGVMVFGVLILGRMKA